MESELPADVEALFAPIPPNGFGRHDANFLSKFLEVRNKLPEGTVLALMHTSIRGRVALGITCFENYVASINFQQALAPLLNMLWESVEPREFQKWDSYPLLVELDAGQESKDPQWPELPQAGEEMLELVGRIDLLTGSVIGFSLDSLWPTLLVLKLTLRAAIPLPDLALFQRSAFHELGGWGNAVRCGFFKPQSLHQA